MAALRIGTRLSTLALVTVVGCAPVQPTTVPTPSPTCTPEAGGTPYPCTRYNYDQMLAKDKLYAEAEAVYRNLLAEDERIKRAGGAVQPTQVLLDNATGAYLDAAVKVYGNYRSHGTVAVGGKFRLAYLRRAPGISRAGSVVALDACVDASTVTLRSKTEKNPGNVRVQRAYFSISGDAMKANYSEWRPTQSCG